MYNIVNRDSNKRIGEASDFSTAFMIQQLFDDKAIIEYWDFKNQRVDIVWDPSWEELNLETI